MTHSQFRWTTGIECSFIPHLGIDQYRWTQHDRFWRTDFELVARDLGCRWVRYALPWHEIETAPGVFDWTWFDLRLAHAENLGITFLLDLVHFGTPAWLPDAFADADFPVALERFARAFAQRYTGRIEYVCPINEPLITALFCGDIGLWPPYGKGLRSYMTVLSRVAQGFCRATRVLRELIPGVQILVSDSLEVAVTYEDSDETTSPFLRESLRADVTRRMHRRHIVTDLILGRVHSRHPLADWLDRHGFPEYDLHWFLRNAQTLDIIGLDYYEHTEVELYTTPEGYYRQRKLDPPLGLYRAAQDYWSQYHIPLMITETSAGGADVDKIAWLEKSVNDVRRLRAEGFPVIGYTWWPVFDHLDWDGALLHQTGHIHPVGIYRLERRGGRLERVPTGLRDVYQKLIAGGDETAGPLIETEAQREHRAAQIAVRAAGAAPLGYPILAHGPVLWQGLWKRPQQILSLLSARHRVLYVEPPQWSEAEDHPRSGLNFYPAHPNLCTLSLHLPAALAEDPAQTSLACRQLVAEALAHAPLAGKFERPVQWFGDPSAAPAYLGEFAPQAVVYDCPRGTPDAALLARADCVFTGTHFAEKLALADRPDAQYLPSGVTVRHFARAIGDRLAIPNDINFVPRPLLGYFGTIDERLDYGLIHALAEFDPNWSVVMVGPVRVNPDHLPRRPNLYWLGKRPYTEMPDYAHGFQVCIAPFVQSAATQGFRPAVLNEYLLSGRPVVSTALDEIRADFTDLVTIAATPEEFIAACREGALHPDRDAIRRKTRIAAGRSWKKVAAVVEADINRVLAAAGDRSRASDL
jgi:beta-glucosidase